jgi:hypothetical protein
VRSTLSLPFLCLVLLSTSLNITSDAFSFKTTTSFPSRVRGGDISHTPRGVATGSRTKPAATSSIQTRMATISSDSAAPSKNDINGNIISNMYSLAGMLSAVAWIATAYVALSFHPDPKFANCTLRHNLLTMSQAFAFPIPIAWASFEALRKSAKNDTLESDTSRRLNLGLAVASLWLTASSAFPPAFAFGYDLYSFHHKVAAAAIHAATGIFALKIAMRTASIGNIIRRLMDSLWKLGPANSTAESGHRNSSSYATGAVGLLYFTIQPIVSPYPLATIPSILGKRLSRPASAFSLLGAIVAYCLKEKKQQPSSASTSASQSADSTTKKAEEDIRRTLRSGLAWGSAAHLFLIVLKLIGVDGGGWIFPGRGLWEVYPAMVNVPFAAGVSMAVHAILCFSAWTEEDANVARND